MGRDACQWVIPEAIKQAHQEHVRQKKEAVHVLRDLAAKKQRVADAALIAAFANNDPSPFFSHIRESEGEGYEIEPSVLCRVPTRDHGFQIGYGCYWQSAKYVDY